MLNNLQLEAHTASTNSLTCANACLVLMSRCLPLSCVLYKGLYTGVFLGMPLFMLTNESLRPRLKAAVPQTYLSKVGDSM